MKIGVIGGGGWGTTLAILAGQLIALAWVLHAVAGIPKVAGCLIGGAVMCYFSLGITAPAFMRQLHDSLVLSPWTFWLGLVKAPVFAVIIALVGCYRGFQVGGSAESVGTQTTLSVVQSIFLVIVTDALFSIVFLWLDLWPQIPADIC